MCPVHLSVEQFTGLGTNVLNVSRTPVWSSLALVQTVLVCPVHLSVEFIGLGTNVLSMSHSPVCRRCLTWPHVLNVSLGDAPRPREQKLFQQFLHSAPSPGNPVSSAAPSPFGSLDLRPQTQDTRARPEALHYIRACTPQGGTGPCGPPWPGPRPRSVWTAAGLPPPPRPWSRRCRAW